MNGETHTLGEDMPGLYSVSRSRKSDAGFEDAALPYLSLLYRMAHYLTRNRAEAEDLLQETFLLALRFFDRFKPGTNIRAWLLAIQRNLFISRYRQKKRESEYIEWEGIDQAYDCVAEEVDSPESLLMSRSMLEIIEKALKHLPVEFRMAVLLVDVQDLTYEEASEVMECPVGTVRSRLSRGRRMLRVALRGYDL